MIPTEMFTARFMGLTGPAAEIAAGRGIHARQQLEPAAVPCLKRHAQTRHRLINTELTFGVLLAAALGRLEGVLNLDQLRYWMSSAGG